MEKLYICSGIGIVGSFIGELFNWNEWMTTLLIFMVLDYITGLIVAGVFKKSPKTQDGSLESKTGWRGLAKKFSTLILVLVAVRLDLLLDTDYIQSAVILAFCANEVISLIENVGLMGVKIPPVISKAISLLNEKGDNETK